MSIFIRLFNSFWTHRKTLRLASILGSDAFWIVPRLWSYASTNQPDGNFKGYSEQEIRMLVGYTKDSHSILQALHDAGFMVDGQLKDWNEHNGYHARYAERARKAAATRWNNQKGNKKGKDSTGKEASNAVALHQAFHQFWQVYPKKVGKIAALAAFKKHCDGFKIEAIVAAVERQKLSEQWTRDGGKYIPNPATWINQGRWEDELPPAAPINQGPNI
jgi:hypothetical protein